MHKDLLNLAEDYKSKVDRVTSELSSLKTDLIAMRKQDVKLLKQLIHINEVIQTFCQKVKNRKHLNVGQRENVIESDLTSGLLAFDNRPRAPLVRQQSVPHYCGAIQSYETCSMGSSFDDMREYPYDENADDNDSIFSLSLSSSFSSNLSTTPSHVMRPRSLSYEASQSKDDLDNPTDSYFEDVLRRNIEIWKFNERSRTCGVSPDSSQ